ncbi:phospholipase/carboxylesterase [Nemania abortiva]|nr:phospholipase/carboxylesterase [Nemania abortiva]
MNPNRSSTSRRVSSSPYIVEPTITHTHTIILLHRLGSSGKRFGEELLKAVKTRQGKTLPDLLPSTRFVFPTAKFGLSSALGRRTTQWFDIARPADPSFRQELQLQGLADSAIEMRELLKEEATRVDPSNIILGGISEGCAMALSVLLSLEYRLGGFVGTCGYLPFQHDVEEAVKGVNDSQSDGGEVMCFNLSDDEEVQTTDPAVRARACERSLLGMSPLPDAAVEQTAVSTPIFLTHGEADDEKPYALGEAAARILVRAGYNVDWKLYPGRSRWHRMPEEIEDIVNFIRETVGWEITDR